MKCILKTNPATGNMRGATLHTTPIELLTILEALRIYEYERDNPIDKATVRQMLEDLKNREVEADRKTENSSEKPNNFAKDINVRSKDEPQDDAEDQFCIEHNCPHFYQFGGCMNQGDCPYDEDEPQTERSE